MKATFWDSSLKKSISASIIASLLFIILIEPIFKLGFNLLGEISDNFYSGLIDSFYKNAAIGAINDMDFIQLFILFSFIFLVNTLMIAQNNEMIKDAVKTLSEEKDDDLNKLDIKELEKRLKESEAKKSQIKLEMSKFLKKVKIFRIVLVFGSLLFTLGYLYILANSYVNLQLNTSFRQRLTILRPYITDSENYFMQSKWALMISRKNFIDINKQLDSIATSVKIQLPKSMLN